MKTRLLILVITIISINTFGQKSPNKFIFTNKRQKNYFKTNSPGEQNKYQSMFSNGLSYGLHGSIGNQYNINPGSTNAISLSTRFLFAENWGVNLKIGFDRFQSKLDVLSKSNFADASLDVMYDLGDLLNFESINYDRNAGKSSFQLYTHVGLGIASMWNKDFNSPLATDPYFKNQDDIINWNVGITPELRLGKHFSINLDFSLINNYLQDRTFNYAIENTKNSSQVYSILFGVNYFY